MLVQYCGDAMGISRYVWGQESHATLFCSSLFPSRRLRSLIIALCGLGVRVEGELRPVKCGWGVLCHPGALHGFYKGSFSSQQDLCSPPHDSSHVEREGGGGASATYFYAVNSLK